MSQDAHDHQDTTSNNEGNTQPAINSDSMRSGKNNGGGSKTRSLVDAGTGKGKGVVKKEEEEERGTKGKSSADVVVAADGRTSGHGRRGDKGHMVTERERRKKMREMFTNLQALLPNIPDKVR